MELILLLLTFELNLPVVFDQEEGRLLNRLLSLAQKFVEVIWFFLVFQHFLQLLMLNVDVLYAFFKSLLAQNKHLENNFGSLPLAIRHFLFSWLLEVRTTLAGLESIFAEQEAFVLR